MIENNEKKHFEKKKKKKDSISIESKFQKDREVHCSITGLSINTGQEVTFI